MANSMKRLLSKNLVCAYGAWNGTSIYADAACAAVPSIAARLASWDIGSRLIVKNAPWLATATLCVFCHSYRAASSYSSHAPSSRAAGAAGEACDLGPLSLLPPLTRAPLRAADPTINEANYSSTWLHELLEHVRSYL